MGLTATLSINYNQHKCHSAQCIVCHNAECRKYFNVMMSIVILNAIMLSVVVLNVVMLSVEAPLELPVRQINRFLFDYGNNDILPRDPIA